MLIHVTLWCKKLQVNRDPKIDKFKNRWLLRMHFFCSPGMGVTTQDERIIFSSKRKRWRNNSVSFPKGTPHPLWGQFVRLYPTSIPKGNSLQLLPYMGIDLDEFNDFFLFLPVQKSDTVSLHLVSWNFLIWMKTSTLYIQTPTMQNNVYLQSVYLQLHFCLPKCLFTILNLECPKLALS